MLGVNFLEAKFKNVIKKFNANKLAYYLPYNFFIGNKEDGIVYLKTGALMKCYTFSCPDLGTESIEYINAISLYFNESIRRLGSGWAVHFESRKEITSDYPKSNWDTQVGFLIDERRKDLFKHKNQHFINYYYLTLTYNVKSDVQNKGLSLLYKDDGISQEYYNKDLINKEIEFFKNMCEEIISYVQSRLYIQKMNNSETLSFIKSSISTSWRIIKAPDHPIFFDLFLTDEDVKTGTTLQIGEFYVPIIAIKDFPSSTYPAMFDLLNKASVEYRWVTRWIGMDKIESAKLIEKYQKRFNNARKSWGQVITEVAANIETDRIDASALAFEEETNEARVMLSKDIASFGYYTSCLAVWDKDYDLAIEKATYIVKLINSIGFTAKVETSNSFQAWLGMMPGNVYANINKTLLLSSNVSHIIPLSSIWTGDYHNSWTSSVFNCSAPLLIASSDSSPFFLNLNIGDVFHTFIFGPSGAGKSTFLCLLETQFFKYKNAQVIVLDKDKTSRGVCIASGGSYVEPGSGEVAFQPLRNLETQEELTWAQEFIQLCLEEQNVQLNARQKEEIRNALIQVRDTKSIEKRDITTFQLYVQDEEIVNGIQPYTIDGQYGHIFDAHDTNIALSRFTMIEMGILMRSGKACITPALFFLFRFIESKFAKENDDEGHPTLLVMDEAWAFLDNPFFSKRIDDWLRTLRKKRVAVVFATQDVPSVAKSAISATILSQCQTRLFLADPNASSKILSEYYQQFGLTLSEINALSMARMKKDYFYKSPAGARMFDLELDAFQLALLNPKKQVLDTLEEVYGRNCGKELAKEILEMQGFDPSVYL